MIRIDLNCDMGESFGAYRIGADEEVLPHVTSANIACGFHAADPSVMRRTVAAALEHGVAVGAHPGLPDLVGFGRRDIAITPEEAYDMVIYQVGALLGFVRAAGGRLQHVKPHGALYTMAAADDALAEAIARAVRDVDPALIFFAPTGSRLVAAGARAGLRTAAEALADRGYHRDGSLVSRRRPDARIADPDAVAARVVRMVTEGRVRSVEGDDVALRVETVGIHGDAPGAAEIARRLRDALTEIGVRLEAVGAGR